MAEEHLRDAYTTMGPYDHTIGDTAWNPKRVNSAARGAASPEEDRVVPARSRSPPPLGSAANS